MLRTPEFWVLVSFVIFVGLLIWKGVPGMIAKALDARAERIRKELDQAQRLREEAQSLLGEYIKRRQDAEKEAEEIVAQAKVEAENYATETRRKLTETIERRTRLAEEKIGRAEDQAKKEVRTAAADLAVRAAVELIADQSKGAHGAKLVDDSIAALKSRLN